MRLGVNIDHIAILKAARKVGDPDVLQAVFVAAQNCADQITIHLREDRRHIDDYDAERIVQHSPIPVNIECALSADTQAKVLALRPQRVTLVPEKREEVTTEGGLDAEKYADQIAQSVAAFGAEGIEVSLFIEADENAVRIAQQCRAQWVEFHTGRYANLWAALNSSLPHTPYAPPSYNLPREVLRSELASELKRIAGCAEFAAKLGVEAAAGHGLNYANAREIAIIQTIAELNIGQSIVARAVFAGLGQSIREMKGVLNG